MKEKITITIEKDTENNIERKDKELEEFLGKEFVGYRGIDAINKLMKERSGYIKDAFYRKKIGNIALVWGDNKKGLQHILKRRKESKQPVATLLKNMAEVIEKGKVEIDMENKKIIISHKRKNAIIAFRNYKNGKFNFLLTAFYDYDYKNNTRR